MEKEWFAQLRGGNLPSKVELFYIWQEGCGVCAALKPKLLALMAKDFPQVQIHLIRASEHRSSLAQLRVLSVPVILLVVEEREYYRANGLVSLGEIGRKLEPVYDAYFKEQA